MYPLTVDTVIEGATALLDVLAKYGPVVALLGVLITLFVNRNTSSRDWLRKVRLEAYFELDRQAVLALTEGVSDDLPSGFYTAELQLDVVASKEQLKASSRLAAVLKDWPGEKEDLRQSLENLPDNQATRDKLKKDVGEAATRYANNVLAARLELANATRRTLGVGRHSLVRLAGSQSVNPQSEPERDAS